MAAVSPGPNPDSDGDDDLEDFKAAVFSTLRASKLPITLEAGDQPQPKPDVASCIVDIPEPHDPQAAAGRLNAIT